MNDHFDDPFLVEAGTSAGSSFRLKRAIKRLESEVASNQCEIKQMETENEKLKIKLERLSERAKATEELQEQFNALTNLALC